MPTLTDYDPDCAVAAAELWSLLATHEGEDADAQLIIARALKEYACEADKRITESEWAQKYREACIDVSKLSELRDAIRALLAVPEVRKAAANWATDELLAVRNLEDGQ